MSGAPKTDVGSRRVRTKRAQSECVDASRGDGRPSDVAFRSILFPTGLDAAPDEAVPTPAFFGDLHLDQIVAQITAGREFYRLGPLFSHALPDVDAIAFRHEVVNDLGDPSILAAVKAFARAMQGVRDHLTQADKFRHPLQRDRWVLDAANLYWSGVSELDAQLSSASLASRGFRTLRAYLRDYTSSVDFHGAKAEGARIAAELAALRYVVRIEGLRVQMAPFADEADYGAQLLSTFQAFRQGGGLEYDFTLDTSLPLNNIETRIIEIVADIHRPLFAAMQDYASTRRDFVDSVVGRFDREIQFYISYLEYFGRLTNLGLAFCLPVVTSSGATISARGTFDLALASNLAARRETPILNDFHLSDPERLLVVSGPNQGGKTTFARTLGQLHHLARLGLPVPGAEARLALTDQIFTHFERVERMSSLRGKLQDDLIRVHGILEKATAHSLIIVNEIFASTSLEDAVALGVTIAQQIIELGSLCVWVTFVEEIASLGLETVSMESSVSPKDPSVRTFKIVRRPPSGLAYAMSIAEKHGLNAAALKERLAS